MLVSISLEKDCPDSLLPLSHLTCVLQLVFLALCTQTHEQRVTCGRLSAGINHVNKISLSDLISLIPAPSHFFLLCRLIKSGTCKFNPKHVTLFGRAYSYTKDGTILWLYLRRNCFWTFWTVVLVKLLHILCGNADVSMAVEFNF